MKNSLSTKAGMGSIIFCAFQSFSVAAYPFLAKELNLSLPALISAFATGSLVFLPANPIWSLACTKFRATSILKTGLVALLLSHCILLILITTSEFLHSSVTYSILLFSRLLYGAFCSAIVPSSGILLNSDSGLPHNGISNASGHYLNQNFGRIAGPAILLSFGFISISLSLIVLLIAGMIIFLTLLPESSELSSPPSVSSPISKGHKPFYKKEGTAIAGMIALTLSFGLMFLQSGIGDALIRISKNVPLQKTTLVSLLFISGTIIAIICQLWLKTSSPKPFAPWCRTGSVLVILSAICLNLSPHISSVWIGYLLFIAGHSLINPINLASMNQRNPNHPSLVFAFFGIIHGIGYGLGSFATAIVHQSDSIQYFQIMTGIASVMVILIMLTQKTSNLTYSPRPHGKEL